MTGDREADLAALRLVLHPAFDAGYEAGLRDGRAQLEAHLLTQDQLLAEVEQQWREWVRDAADLQRLAGTLAGPSHLQLVRRRHHTHGTPGPAALELLRRAEAQDERVWAGWPTGHTA